MIGNNVYGFFLAGQLDQFVITYIKENRKRKKTWVASKIQKFHKPWLTHKIQKYNLFSLRIYLQPTETNSLKSFRTWILIWKIFFQI